MHKSVVSNQIYQVCKHTHAWTIANAGLMAHIQHADYAVNAILKNSCCLLTTK